MSSPESTTCAVVGGGPAGIVLGLLLARAGVEVTVFEKHGDFLRDFRGDTVHPATLTLIEDLGLYGQFSQLPHSEVKKAQVTVGGHTVTIADFGRLHEPHPLLALVPQWDLLNLLAGAARAEPPFTLRMSTEVTGILREGGKVAGVRYTGADGAGELSADLTVACDGRTSTVRSAAGLIPREHPVPFDVAWLRLDMVDRAEYQVTPRFGAGLTLILLPREGYFQAGVLIPKGTERRMREGDLDAFLARVTEAVPEASTAGITSWDDVKTLDVRMSRLQRWYQPGLLCIGDAAHAMSPAGGVGINLAVADAVATARILAEPLLAGRVTEADLAAVQRRRQFATVVTQGFQRLLGLGIGRLVSPRGRPSPPPKVARVLGYVLSRLRPLSFFPAYVIGVGVRPERAPAFARRSGPPALPQD